MSISLIVVALGVVVAVAGTGVLVNRFARSPRARYLVWALAALGLAAGLGSQLAGDLAGYDGTLFRAMELGAQLIAPLALCLSLVEVIGKSVTARFAMRLAVSAIAVVALVVMGTDPLSQNVSFSKTWPDPGQFYQPLPLAVLDFLTAFTLITALVAAVVIMFRSPHDELAKAATRPVMVACAAAVLITLPGLARISQSSGGVSVPLSGRSLFALACTGTAALTWFAAQAAVRLDRAGAAIRSRGDGRHDDDWRDERGRPEAGEYGSDEFDRFDPVTRGGRFGAAEADRDWSEPGARSFGDADGEVRYPGLAALAAGPDEPSGGPGRPGRYGDPGPYGEPGQGEFEDSDPYSDADGRYDSARYEGPGRYDGGNEQPGRYEDADHYGEPGRHEDADHYDGPGRYGDDPKALMFGQITIYTLIEDRIGEFDRLTERIVARVREQEPGTLAYIVHAVPTAPMQRILYEVYRDRLAYDDHLRQPHIARYETERRPFVLATNVIELGLQQAKVSAFPSFSAISDILSESGIDLTGVTRSSRAGGPPQQGRGQPGPAPSGRPASPQSSSPPDPRQAGDPGHPRQAGDPGYPRQYQGWDEIRGEDQRYR